MNTTYQIKKWDSDHPALFAVLRVILGIALTVRGIYFLNNSLVLQHAIEVSGLDILNGNALLTMLITWVHICGGIFIVLGLFTRVAIWVQIPILIGAIVFVNLQHWSLLNGFDLFLSVFILVLLLIIAAGGSGVVSMDHYLRKYVL